jgi:hypothetical protein
MNIVFPNNPSDGEVFEYSSGIYYQYSKATKSWKKIVGLTNVPLATSSNDGLMTKEDFNKLQSLMIPPPQTSLTADECNTVYKEGIVKIESSKNDLNIVSSLNVLNGPDKEKVDFIIHENTMGIDFSINMSRLIEELETRGKIKYRATVGDDGDQGERGKPGRDNIETGPRGPKGKNGKNAPFAGTLVQDYTVVDQTKIKKVVVDIKNDPDDPRKLIVVFGNVGNLSACPDRIHWKNKKTPWLVAVKDKIGPCHFPSGCYKNVCSTEIYYIDTTTIQDQIKERFVVLLTAAKVAREKLVREWLNAMSEMFNSQKQALCCAVEAIDSKEKNQVIRNSWSMARYAAAQAMYAFKLTSDDDTKYPRADPQQNPQDFLSNHPKPETGGAKLNWDNPDTFKCNECFLIVDLLNYNVGQSKPISIDLPAGSYISTIIQCCPEYDRAGYSGRYNVKFVDHDADGNKVQGMYSSNDKGYMDANTANASYTGESLAFRHYGGVVSFYLNPPPPNASAVSLSGGLKLCVQPTKCFESCSPPNPTSVTGSNVSVEPTVADLPSSYIRASHAAFYERGWRIKNACAAHTSVLGTQFIVVFRSIGTDVSCGGGEYSTTPFIKFFNNELNEQVAIAWPTIDGEGFFGLPRDDGHVKIQLVYDKDLSDMIVNNINSDIVFKTIGNPKGSIKKVVVPILDVYTGGGEYTGGGSEPTAIPDVTLPGLKWSFNESQPEKPRNIVDDGLYNIPCNVDGNTQIVNGVIQSASADAGGGIFFWINSKWITKGNSNGYGPVGTEMPVKAGCISGWFKFTNHMVNSSLGFSIYNNMTKCFNSDAYCHDTTIDCYIFKNSLYNLNPPTDYMSIRVTVRVSQGAGASSVDTTAEFMLPSPDFIAVDSWVHVAFNRVSDKYIDFYLNGEKLGTIGAITVGNGDYIWGVNIKTILMYGGVADQIRLYDQPITADEVKDLFLLGRNIN